MAGLAAAARARELGAEPIVLEKGDRPGGSMLLSSGVIWRHRELQDFRAECPGGDPVLQKLIFDRLDEALDWLETLGGPVLERDTGNPRTIGRRFDTRGLTEALSKKAKTVHLGQAPVPDTVSDTGTWPDVPLLLATGGFHVRLARELGLPVRGNPWSEGEGLDLALERGATVAGNLEEFYGRGMPAGVPLDEAEFVPLSQLYGRFAEVVSEDGTQRFEGEPQWSEIDLVQTIARWQIGRAHV